jgi:hypothetical protein
MGKFISFDKTKGGLGISYMFGLPFSLGYGANAVPYDTKSNLPDLLQDAF